MSSSSTSQEDTVDADAAEAKRAQRQQEIVAEVQTELRLLHEHYKDLPATGTKKKGHCYRIVFPHNDYVIVARAQLEAHGTFIQLDKSNHNVIYVYPGFKPKRANKT